MRRSGGPKGRPPIHSSKMGVNSGECTQSPSSSQGLKNGKEDGSTSQPPTDSKEDDGDKKNDSGTGDSRLTKKPESTKENTASPYCNSSVLTKIIWDNTSVVALSFIAVVIAVFIALHWGGYLDLTTQDTTTQDTENVQTLSSDIKRIREEFPSQEEYIWGAFSSGIKETTQGIPTKPSVFMLLYETEDGTASCLAQRVGNISTHILKAGKSDPLLIIDGADLEHNETLAKDYGKLLEEYRPKVEEQRAMIINNLHKIPGIVAQSFHSFCDTVTPAVDKAVYLFTMKASGFSNRHNPTEVAEEELRKLWSGELDEDRLNPLITRITDMTVKIKPEKNLAQC